MSSTAATRMDLPEWPGVFGKHDRPWKERGIFGTVRYMNEGGLKRKFDADEYVRMVERLEAGS